MNGNYQAQTNLPMYELSRDDVLSIDQLEESGAKQIWVLNTSHNNNAGAVSFQIESSGTSALNIEVPYTFVAIDLCWFSRPANIINNENFRRAVARRLLTIVTPEFAAIHNKSDAAYLELEKIRSGFSVGVNEPYDAVNASNALIGGGTQPAQLGTPQVGQLQTFVPNPEIEVDQRIIAVMCNTRMDENTRIGALRSNRSNIKLADAFYISMSAVASGEEEVSAVAAKILKQSKQIARDAKGDGYKEFMSQSQNSARMALRG